MKWDYFKNILFFKVFGRKTIDILIGLDYFEFTLVLIECYGLIGVSVVRKTLLGWICVGRLFVFFLVKRIVYVRIFRIKILYEIRFNE